MIHNEEYSVLESKYTTLFTQTYLTHVFQTISFNILGTDTKNGNIECSPILKTAKHLVD